MAINNPVITDSDWLQATAVAIQNKDGGSKMEAPDFASRIDALPAAPVLIPKTITENGTYTAEDDNADGYSEVTVAVPREITKLVDGTITEYIDDEVTTIAPYAFYGISALTVCRTPNVQTIGTNAFRGSSLADEIIRFPNCQTIEPQAFRSMVYNDNNPRRAIFPKLLNIQNANAFSGGTAWVTIPCLVFKQKVTLETYSVEFFSTKNNANTAISKLYVPQRYFDWYTTATNWSAGYTAYPNSIRTIEDNIDYLVNLGFSREELLREDEVPTI